MRWTAKTPGFWIDSAAGAARRNETKEHDAASDLFSLE
jgi:hypothetical protein